MTETPSSARHHIFLLSVWREDEELDPLKLRYRLENPRTGERHMYSSLDLLLAALKTVIVDPLMDGDRGGGFMGAE